jgi:deazaflavin-dependent oxidoreductase (nitroreductase family)
MQTVNDQIMPYPRGIGRKLLRIPLLLYRLGLGEVANAANILVLTTRGHKTGLTRHTPLEYRQHGSKIYIVSAWGERPNWYQNLRAHPVVTLQQGRKQVSARAHPVTNSGEALAVLHLFRRRAPVVYDAVLARMSDRGDIAPRTLPDIADQITIVRLTPEPGALALAPLPANLTWIVPSGLLFGISLAVLLTLARSKRSTHE